jgi:hypothetical protein
MTEGLDHSYVCMYEDTGWERETRSVSHVKFGVAGSFVNELSRKH